MEWLLPPRIKVLVRAIFSRRIGFTRVKSWGDAIAKSAGYESHDVIQPLIQDVQARREVIHNSYSISSRYQQVATAMLHCLSELGLEENRRWRVLDIGGGSGDYFYYFKKFAHHLNFEWTVLETPALANAMIEANRDVSESIRWESSIDEVADSFDVVLLSSVLQYVEFPKAMLATAAEKTEFVVINRLPLIPGLDDVVALQRIRTLGRKGSYPAHFFAEEPMIETLSNYGRIEMRWMVPEDQPVLGWRSHPNQGFVIRVGDPTSEL